MKLTKGKQFLITLGLILILCGAAFLLPAYRLIIKETAPPQLVIPADTSSNSSEPAANTSSSAPPIPSLPFDFSPAPKPNPSGFKDDYTYEDDTIKVKISKEKYDYQACTIAEVWITHPSQLRTAFAEGGYNSPTREHLSDIAKRNNAVLAVNTDYYNMRKDGIIIRQGILYRNKPSGRHMLIIDAKGDFHTIPENAFNLTEWENKGIINSFSFGPALVIDGVQQKMPNGFPEGAIWELHPRTAIGQLGELHYLVVTVDGKQAHSSGLLVNQLAAMMKEKGCIQAFNMDGGQSTVMTFNNKVMNIVAYDGERRLSDIMYFATALDYSAQHYDPY
ncbi:MAG: phosphodiester glycosidase family protein [Oscillospiraceae bacterium]|jgi:exopolysaccharide biosynthesis protein|nr:phosphodiester glycosidase family protein [Oscillospiraceae bacterium]